jgi:hypothetical protein
MATRHGPARFGRPHNSVHVHVPMSELDRLAIIGRVMRLAAIVVVMAVVVGSASWLGMRPHPARTTAMSGASGTVLTCVASGAGDVCERVGQPNRPLPLNSTGGSSNVTLLHPPGVPDLYVVPGVGNFVFLTDGGACYCGPVAYPSDTIFVPPPSGNVTPCRCMDMRNAPPVYPIVHVVSPALPCRCVDTRLTAPSTT